MLSFDEALEAAVNSHKAGDLRQKYTAFTAEASANTRLKELLCMHAGVFVNFVDELQEENLDEASVKMMEFLVSTTLYSVFILGLVVGREMEQVDLETLTR